MKYRTIVADPPWPISEEHPVLGAVPYDTMSLDAICTLNVRSVTEVRDDDAELYLWTTSHHLFDAPEVAEAWGFTYTATLVWCKPPRGAGMGCAYTSNVEFILYCRRAGYVSMAQREPRPDIAEVTTRIGVIVAEAGVTTRDLNVAVGATDIASWWTSSLPLRCAIPKPEHWLTLTNLVPALHELDEAIASFNAVKGTNRKPPVPLATRVDTRWFTWPRGSHSQKPEAFYDMVESVSPGPYLELFARRNRLGWDTWGNEALEHVAMESR
jgi:N6-adenosine-specific RNA methylase IME4